ncbi:hypothetical protein [Haliangium sp.]|uniref:hypothetical protein n=1 Tax=Haliangium sp. TaxID=2663208 RepID=UPI003D0BC209
MSKVIDARGYRIRPRSRFSGEKGDADAKAADKALQLALLEHGEEPISAVLLIRDTDDDLTRRQGLEQARQRDGDEPWPFEIIIGVEHAKREAWVLAGCEPTDSTEQQNRLALRRELGFDPCTSPEQLTASEHGAKRDVKRVFKKLLADDWDRQERCWRQTPLETLRRRGGGCGLSAYLDEVEARLVPLFGAGE